MSEGLRTKRWQGERSDEPGVILEDLENAGWYRSLTVVEEGPAQELVSGDLGKVLDDIQRGLLFRYVVFRARGPLPELLEVYSSGFGELAAGLCESKAILLDRGANALISLSVWKDWDALKAFLDHEGFGAAQEPLGPLLAAPPRAESLRVA